MYFYELTYYYEPDHVQIHNNSILQFIQGGLRGSNFDTSEYYDLKKFFSDLGLINFRGIT